MLTKITWPGYSVTAPNPGKPEISRDKYLGTDCFLAKKQENNP
jgi:hypothetical protein